MELDKLKEIWISLDNRMQQQEILKSTLIKEMLINKSDKALSRLINYSYFGIILCIAVLPLLIWISSQSRSFDIMNNIFIPITILFSLTNLAVAIIQLIKLHKIDFSKAINRNIYSVQKLNIFNKRYYIIFTIIAFIIVFITIIVLFISYSAYIAYWRWLGIITAIIAGSIFCFWEYKRIYRRNFNTILKSLEELKELEEME